MAVAKAANDEAVANAAKTGSANELPKADADKKPADDAAQKQAAAPNP